MPRPFHKSEQKTQFSKTNHKNCEIQEKCGSCSYVNEDYKKFYKLKYEEALANIEKVVSLKYVQCMNPNVSPRLKGYRTSVKLAIRPKAEKNPKFTNNINAQFDIGLFAPKSHKLISIDKCYTQHQGINNLISSIKKLLQESKLAPYNEKVHSGDLRYLLIRMSHISQEFMVTFVATNKSCYSELRQIIKQLKTTYNVTASFLNINTEQTNKITGDYYKKIIGNDKLRESLCNFNLRISPQSFFQINPWVAQKIYQRVEQLVGKSSQTNVSAWDLYCGVGVFSLVLLKSGYNVLGIEENPYAIKDAICNAQDNLPSSQFEFKANSVEDFLQKKSNVPTDFKKPEIIVLNPSRKGLDDSVCKFLITYRKENPSHKLIYVSCEEASLSKNLKQLISGGYKLRQLESFDMFPHTEKIEWLAVLN